MDPRIADLRKSYEKAELDEHAAAAEPLQQFETWLQRQGITDAQGRLRPVTAQPALAMGFSALLDGPNAANAANTARP